MPLPILAYLVSLTSWALEILILVVADQYALWPCLQTPSCLHEKTTLFSWILNLCTSVLGHPGPLNSWAICPLDLGLSDSGITQTCLERPNRPRKGTTNYPPLDRSDLRLSDRGAPKRVLRGPTALAREKKTYPREKKTFDPSTWKKTASTRNKNLLTRKKNQINSTRNKNLN